MLRRPETSLLFGHGVQHPSRWRLLLAAGVLGTNGVEPATIIVAIACAKGVPLELQARFGPQAVAAVSNSQWAAFGADRPYMETLQRGQPLLVCVEPPPRLSRAPEYGAKGRIGGLLPARDALSVPGAARAHARRTLGPTAAAEG